MKTKRIKKHYTKFRLLNWKWDKRFNELQKFKNKYGHCHIMRTDNLQLYQWCFTQKLLFKKKAPKLTKDRKDRLTKLGFEWQNRLKLLWEWHFAELKKYKKKCGNCNVPCINDNKSPLYILSRWVRAQRENYNSKNNCLTPERKVKLENLGFSFINPFKRGKKRIDDKYLIDDLKRLYELTGKAPTAPDIKNYSNYCLATYETHFGGLLKARKAAGILIKPVTLRYNYSREYKYSDNELFDELKRIAILLGRPPRPVDVKKHGKYSKHTYYYRFGSFDKANKAAGISFKLII